MTCKELIAIEYPEKLDSSCLAGVEGCPHKYGYTTEPKYCNGPVTNPSEEHCEACWDREVPNKVLFEKCAEGLPIPNHAIISESTDKVPEDVIVKFNEIPHENIISPSDARKILAMIEGMDIPEKPKILDSGNRREFESGAVRDMQTGKGDMVSLPNAAILRLSKHYENGALKYGRWNYTKGIPVSSFLDSALRHLFKYLDGWDDEDHLSAAAFNVLGAMEMEAHHKELLDIPSREGKNCFDY